MEGKQKRSQTDVSTSKKNHYLTLHNKLNVVGKVSVAKDMVEAMDEEKKSITYKVTEGDALELYRDFRMTLHVDTNGDDSIVTWTMDYEKVKENVPDPRTLMDCFLQITKDLDAHTYGLSPPNHQRY